MSKRILRSPAAEQDLIDIWTFIAADNLDATDRLLDLIGSRIHQLANYPFSGAERNDIAAGLRMLPVSRYVVLYRIDEREVVIVRVVHGARDASALF